MASGAEMAFYLFLSLFPFLIFLINILVKTPLADIDFLRQTTDVLPREFQEILMKILIDTVDKSSEALLSISGLTGLWAASRGVSVVMKTLNRAYEIEEVPSSIFIRLLALFFTLALVLLMVILSLSLVFRELLSNFIIENLDPWLASLWEFFMAFGALAAMIFIFSLLYRFLPASKRSKLKIGIRYSLPGAIFASLAWIGLSKSFSYYMANFANYSASYGSLGGVVALLVWLQLSSVIIISGGLINSSYYFLNHEKEILEFNQVK